jgi:low affinity Fe/Cu permease
MHASQSTFSRFAQWVSRKLGHPLAFVLAVIAIVVWAVSGPFFHFSDTWQLVVNTSTTIITFLMVFIIQNTQNRDNEAIQLKLDELIRSGKGAHNEMLGIEDLTDVEIEKVRMRYAQLAKATKEELKDGLKDTGVPKLL